MKWVLFNVILQCLPEDCACADTLRWRQEAKIDECLETFLPDDKDNKLRRFLPSGFVGLDKAVSIPSSNLSLDQPFLPGQQYCVQE